MYGGSRRKMSIQKHFTVSVFIVHENKVLLHLHRKCKKILPIGGHVEANELPEEACIREAKEESGLAINLYNTDSSIKNLIEEAGEKLLLKPMHMVGCEIEPEHYHMDFNYYATADTFDLKPLEGESKVLYWYTKEELGKIKNAPKGVIAMAKEALELLACTK
jgi:ADP-ribose pyrophosphatase YjhB (NUDIX family)